MFATKNHINIKKFIGLLGITNTLTSESSVFYMPQCGLVTGLDLKLIDLFNGNLFNQILLDEINFN